MFSRTKIFLYMLYMCLMMPVLSLAFKIDTPLKLPEGTKDGHEIAAILKVFIGAMLDLLVPIIVLAIVYVGFLFVKAQGNESELTKAKEALVYVLIGTAVVIAANAAYGILYVKYNPFG